MVKALRRSGRLRVMVATWSATSYVISVNAMNRILFGSRCSSVHKRGFRILSVGSRLEFGLCGGSRGSGGNVVSGEDSGGCVAACRVVGAVRAGARSRPPEGGVAQDGPDAARLLRRRPARA